MAELKENTQPSSLAEEIANNLNDKYSITWVSPWHIQLFISLTYYVRNVLYAYLTSLKAGLIVEKSKLVRQSLKGNAIADKISQFRVLTKLALQPVDSFLKIIPIDSTLKVIPEVNDFLATLTNKVSVKIPESFIYDVAGIGGFELFEGITDYASLKEKIDELEFRATRATALSTYARATSSYIDNYLNKVDVYLDIIVTLNASNI